MWNDPIIEELHKFRDEHAARFNDDIDAIVIDLQNSERSSNRPVVSFAPKMYHDLPGQDAGSPFLSSET
ncbi:MAG: hypothetical protein H7829_01145 [Magnetococcus sp. THC-1_WYH]